MRDSEKTVCKGRNWLRCAGFLLLAALMLHSLAGFLAVHGLSDTTKNNFFHQEDHSFDILYIGSCHAFTSVMPSVIEERTGLHGYVLSAGNMDPKMMLFLLEAALEHQTPKYVALEMITFAIYDSYISLPSIETNNRNTVADLPFGYKARYIREEIKNGNPDWFYYLFEAGYFHENWTNPELYNTRNESPDNGWLPWTADVPPLPYQDMILQQENPTEEQASPEETNKDYLVQILHLLEEKNIQPVFFIAPYLITDGEIPIFNRIRAIAEEKDIPFLNMTDNQILKEMQFYRAYMRDSRHVNADGAKVVSEYFAGFLQGVVADAGTNKLKP